jgi:hypothetical protein
MADPPPLYPQDEEETLESPRSSADSAPPPRALSLPRIDGEGDDDTEYHIIGSSPTPADSREDTQYYTLGMSDPDDEPTQVSKRPRVEPDSEASDDPDTEYYTLGSPDAATGRRPADDITAPSMSVSGDEDDEVYYTLDSSNPGGIPTRDVALPPRLLSPDDEVDDPGDDVELDLDPETHPELDLMDLDDIGEIGAIDLETLPELDLDDETIPEVDLGPPVFLELKPKPDPEIPVSTVTLVHLTQFLIEIDT